MLLSEPVLDRLPTYFHLEGGKGRGKKIQQSLEFRAWFLPQRMQTVVGPLQRDEKVGSIIVKYLSRKYTAKRADDNG